jgi:hypothetical protein
MSEVGHASDLREFRRLPVIARRPREIDQNGYLFVTFVA